MLKPALLTVAVLGLATSAAAVNLVTNPGFELGDSTETVYNAGDTGVTGWTLSRGSVFYAGAASWEDAELLGTRSLELNGGPDGSASISQFVNLTAGTWYTLSFMYAADPALNNPSIAGSFDIGRDKNNKFIFTDAPGLSPTNMGWTLLSYNFKAMEDGATLLAFRQGSLSSTGLTIDSVFLSIVPEPATWALLIAGFGMVGFSMRRRRGAIQSVAA